jgi:hypothetical protein
VTNEFDDEIERAAQAFHDGGLPVEQEFMPAVHLTPEKALARKRTEPEVLMKQALMKQHPIHGVFADVFDRLGGSDFLYGWAAENPDKFLNMFSRMTPSLSPSTGHHGDIKITVNTAIARGALDG